MSSARLRMPSNRTTSAFIMKSIIILIFLFTCTSVALAETEDSNDFVFDDKNLQEIVTEEKVHKYTSSHENSHQKTVSLVDLPNHVDGNDDLIAEGSYYNQIKGHLRRLKRDIFGFDFGSLFTTPSSTQPTSTESLATSLNTAEMKTTADKTKRSSPDDPEIESKEDTEDDDSLESDIDTNVTNTISSSGDYSSPIPSPTNDGAVRRVHFRIVITLMVSYTNEMSDHNSVLFNDYADKIHTAMYDIFKAPNFIKPRLAAIINSAKSQVSKAIIDLELEGKESSTEVESKIATHLATYGGLSSVPATSEGLMVKDYEGSLIAPCDISQIPCLESNVCYSITKRCDGKYECSDNSDETDCPASDQPNPSDSNHASTCRGDSTYVCQDNGSGKSITICMEHKCDGRLHCPLGDDEWNCTISCSEVEFVCDGKCLPNEKLCDGNPDCGNASDEVDCPPPKDGECLSNQIKCYDGTCINGPLRCDGKPDCSNGEDELGCPNIEELSTSRPTPRPPFVKPGCTSGQFRCANGDCVDIAYRCDNVPHCSDYSDEEHCSTTPKPCDSPSEFLCRSGLCIDRSRLCDGKGDCPDFSDEDSCSKVCRSDEFNCGDGRCIKMSFKCDGLADCENGRDEIGCPPPPITCKQTEFDCGNNRCIPLQLKCNGAADCQDGRDENGCPAKPRCSPTEFDCGDNRCIAMQLKCDGLADCENGRDEIGCPARPLVCNSTQFDCGDNRCIPIQMKCDGLADCENGRDETGCPPPSTCKSTEFDCGDKRCIPSNFKCDGLADCENGRDEMNCSAPKLVCKATEFDCGDKRCIPSQLKCDGMADCENGRDEIGCPFQEHSCKSTEFDCGDGRCIVSSMRCDNFADCENGKDEMGCTPRPYITSTTPTTSPYYPFCRAGQYACRKTFQCISDDLRCNGRQDCYDATDEDNCGESMDLNLKAIPTDQIIKESQEVVFQCRDESLLRAPIRWERGNGLPLPPGSRVSEFGRLEIPNIQLSHGGPYICRASDEYRNLPKSQIQVYLQVQPFTTPAPVAPAARCRPDEATCHNGDCIPRNLVCNGQNDCADGSDELRCNPHGCEPNEFRCKNLRCVSKTWRCDSEDDCGDGSDEESCEPAPPGSPCRYDEFACTNVTQCVPKSMQCDFENDCQDGTDEHGCSKVTVIQPPIPSIIISVGERFTITCNTIGTPMPEVIWRWNWGHVPPRCTSTSVNGFGTLTCVNVQVEDAGAYSCEAINSRGSVFAPVDTIVTIRYESAPTKACRSNEYPTTDGCIDCFCFKATNVCTRARNLYVFNLPVSGDKFRVINVLFDRRRRNRLEIKGNEISDPSLMVDVLSGDQFRVHGAISQSLYFENTFPYLALPDTFLGNQLKSYGGYISFLIRYESDDAPLQAPHLIIAGGGRKLVSGGATFSPGAENRVSTQFAVGSWFHEGDDLVVSPTRNVPASREEILSILANLEYILIRAQWTTSNNIDVTISEFKFDSARSVGSTEVGFVEQCTCPAGYTGLSCENCEPGYERIRTDSPYGTCRRVVIGCEPGYFGSPARGIPCRPCPCPLTEASNQFGHTCHMESDGRSTCDCPPGYEGRNCERCSAGFYGSPLVLGSSCERTPCDTAGSISPVIDPVSRSCSCKQNVFGPYCKQCKVGTFFLHSAAQYGCINCFCMGVSKECQSSALYRQHIVSTFGQDTQEFKIALRKDVAASPISDIFTNPPDREIVYRPTSNDNNGVLYWILPQKFLNDKTTSYGGVLNYTLRFTPASPNSPRNVAPDVEIYSGTRRVRLLYYRQGNPLEPDAHQTISVPLREQYWQREDGQIANREHLLMTLSHLTMIIIKASYTTTTAEVALQSVLLETAEDRNTGYRRAYEVEECRCPEGHEGLSCQMCSPGYYRSDNLYLGTCQPCNCNGLSRECDPETGYCLNCANHAYGPKCEQCEPGYIGEPTKGVPCRRTSEPNCNCDPRGSVDSSCRGGSCACKANVVGQRCDQCRPGTFDLRTTRDVGCMDCYCSGVSQQCQSSDAYTTQILVSVLEQNPGFALTDSNRNRVITSGLNLNPARNEIQFDYTTERGNRLYWSLPPILLGNKITSYGGSLTWTQGYDAPAEFIPQYDSDLIIIGDGITLHWTNNNPILPNQAMPITVKLEEKSFRRVTENGTQIATRTDLMRVLSNIEAILVRALYASQTTSVYISDVLLDIAVTQRLSAARATQVEFCVCPVGYKGTSCEGCDRGYYHVVSGDGVTKECRRCPCNGNEESCEADASSRVTCRCRPNYSGDFCEVAAANQIIDPNLNTTPTVSIQTTDPKVQSVALGTTVQYTVRARSIHSNAPLVITWSKIGGTLPSDRVIDDGRGTLVITSVIASDSGVYVCTVYDGITYVREEFTLTVTDVATSKPKISIMSTRSDGVSVLGPDDVLEIDSGEILNIRCESTGVPTPTVEWMKLGTPALERKLNPGSISFLVTSVSSSNAGTYFCRASNRYGTDQQRLIVRVRETAPPPPTPGVRITIQPPEFNGYIGDSVRFMCSVEPSFGLRYLWTRGGTRPLPEKATSDPQGELTIYNVGKADAGEYICSAVNEATGAVVGRMEVYVRVVDRSDSGLRPPTVSIDPTSQRVPQGSLAVIRCTSSDPRAQISWRKMNENLTSSADILIRGSELRIPSVQLKHRGNYLCYVTNQHGSGQAYSRLEVDRREFPSVEIYPKERNPITEGGDTLIQCKVNRGIPAPRLRWYRPGNLTMSPRVEEISGVLRFTHVTAEDEGEYICSAENIAGHVDAVAFLEITVPPKIHVSPPGPISISIGQYLKLECRADGKPTPQVVWRSGSLPSSPYSSNPESTHHTAVYEIPRAQMSDSGAYTCTASNIAGQVEDVVHVVVNGSPSNNIPSNQLSPNIQASLSPDEEVAFPVGSKATFRCDMGNQKDAEYLYWQREGGELSEQRDEQNGILIIYNVRESDAGKYTCIGVGKRATVLFKKTINLRVVVPPQIHLNPIRQVVRPGDNAYVSCSATGDQPISVYWSAVGGNQLPKSVSVDRGTLQFHGITIYDAGKYVCRAENFAGRVEAVAEVLVNEVNRPSRPTITALQRTQTAIEGSDVDLRCEVKSSNSEYQIKWNRDKSGLPRRSELFGDTLRLISVTPADIDRYTCEVESPYGSSTDFIDLFVDRSCLQDEFRCNDGITCIPNSQVCDNTRNCPDNSDEVNCHYHRRGINKTANDDELTDFHMNAGDSFRLSCWINDTSSGPTRGMWSRIDGSIDSNVQIEGNLLSINNVQIGNAGNYRCSVFTSDGDKFKDYTLHVKLDYDLPPTLASMSKKTVQYGDTIELLCAVDLEPPVNYSWVLHTHEKSLRKIVNDVKNITIPNASVSNSGLYFCNAVGKDFTFRLPTMLLVEGVIPAFKGTSYMTFLPLTQATMSFNIEITFKPNHREGLLLYTGQSKNGKGDFMAFGLNRGYPEFKFDVGYKPVTITADEPVTLHEWHTVRLIREGKTGIMEVDGRWNVTKTAEGKHETLDLTLPLYVGGLPNFEVIKNRTGFTSGYMGCLKSLVIDSNSYDLKKAVYSNDLVSCNTCANDPCLNGGGCQESLSSSTGFMCICPPGYSGEQCAYAWDTCYLDTCGEGHCIENESGSGTECQCPYGKTGKACAQNVVIKTPAFTKNSYLAYPSMFMKKDKLDISLIVKPVGENDVEDGIVAYVAEDEDGLSDYVAISIVNAFVELEGKIMSKNIKIRSERLLKPGKNITIHAVISPSFAKLVVDDEIRESEFNPTNEIHDLKFNTALYVGGVDRKTIILPSNIIIKNGLFGCVPNVKLNGMDITHVQTYTDSANVNDCLTLFGDICEKSQPCLNNGKCYPHGTKGYRCECELAFAGDNCDRKKNVCEMLKPCKNNAECQVTDGNNFLCSCPLGFTGSICDESTVVESTASFLGHGFVELNSVLLPHEGEEFFSITFITNSTSGLLFWQGTKEKTLRPNDDFLSLTVENGYVQLNYRIKSVEREIKASDHKVNDGLSHTVVIRLTHQRISVELDSRATDYKEVTPYGRLQTRGSIFIGGLPNIRYMTQNMFRNNFHGCIQSLKVNTNHAINFGLKAVSASNVAPCSAVFTNEVSHK